MLILDGKGVAAKVQAAAADDAAALRARGVVPTLAVVLVGEDPASQVYVGRKRAAARAAGIEARDHLFPRGIDEARLLTLIRDLNADRSVHGILVQLPLPREIDADQVIAALDPVKDVDGFHPINVGRLVTGMDGFVPCTPLGCLKLLRSELGDLKGKDAVVIGRSNIVGKPMAMLLLGDHCTVTIAHSRTRDLPEVVRRADIVVAAVGLWAERTRK